MKKECELQKSQEDEADSKKEKKKTSQGLIEEILKESQDDEADVDEEKEKTLEDLIEEILEEELSVDVDVKRKGPFLWISRGSYICLTSMYSLQFKCFQVCRSSPSPKCSKVQPVDLEESQRWGLLSLYLGACCCCCGSHFSFSS